MADEARGPAKAVFISHAGGDWETAELLEKALLSDGLGSWVFLNELHVGMGPKAEIVAALDAAEVVVALVSSNFAASKPCTFETLHTQVRSLREGVDRHLVVAMAPRASMQKVLKNRQAVRLNPLDSGASRTLDELLALGPDGTLSIAEVAKLVAHRVSLMPAKAPRPIDGDAIPTSLPRAGQFDGLVGRFDVSLQLYGAIMGVVALDRGTLSEQRHVALVGMGGMGKTAVAQHFADQFRAAFPGGVVWIEAGGDDVRNEATSIADRNLVVRKIRRQVTAWIDGTVKRLNAYGDGPQLTIEQHRQDGEPLALLRESMARAADLTPRLPGPMLWVIDDLPDGAQDLVGFISCPPGVESLTVVTTRDPMSEADFETIDIGPLDIEDAVLLLRNDWNNDQAPDDAILAALAEGVGRYPLALGVIRALLRGNWSQSTLRDRLANPSDAALIIAANNSTVLPTGHAANIVATLEQSFAEAARVCPDAVTMMRLLARTGQDPFVPLDLVSSVLKNVGASSHADDLVSSLSKVSLLEMSDGDKDQPVGQGMRVHAITRMVARELVGHGSVGGADISDPVADRAVAIAAARWYHRQGDVNRNQNDGLGARWFARALVPLEPLEVGLDADELVLLNDCWRGVARAEMRSPSTRTRDPKAPESEAWTTALDLARRAQASGERALQRFPSHRALVRATCQAEALHGDLLDHRAERAFRAGDLPAAMRTNAEALELVDRQLKTRTGLVHSVRDEPLPTSVDPADIEAVSAARAASLRLAQIDAARSAINVPGRLILRAKLLTAHAADGSRLPWADRARARKALARARELYSSVELKRQGLFEDSWGIATSTTGGGAHGPLSNAARPKSFEGELLEIAACIHGRAVVDYVEANLLTTPVAERRASLIRACSALSDAITVRMMALKEDDVSKSVALALKIGLALRALNSGMLETSVEAMTRFVDEMEPLDMVDTAGLPPADKTAKALSALIEEATQVGAAKGGAKGRRDAAAAAVLMTLGTITELGVSAPGGALDRPAEDLVQAAVSWLEVVKLTGKHERLVTVSHAMEEWDDEGQDWLPVRSRSSKG